MKVLGIVLLCCLRVLCLVDSSQSRENNVPAEAWRLFHAKKLDHKYKLSMQLNLLYLSADFNGDGKNEIIVPIAEKRSDKSGFAIFDTAAKHVDLVGAGTAIGPAYCNTSSEWLAMAKSRVPNKFHVSKLHGDAIFLAWEMKGCGIYYWDGTKIRWEYLEGD